MPDIGWPQLGRDHLLKFQGPKQAGDTDRGWDNNVEEHDAKVDKVRSLEDFLFSGSFCSALYKVETYSWALANHSFFPYPFRLDNAVAVLDW